MKPIASILALLIGILMIQPLFAGLGLPPAYEACPAAKPQNECASERSCDQTDPCEDKEDKKDCKNKGCNPLLGCSSGNFYIHSYSTIILNHFIISKAKTALVNDNRILKQSNECWHPPELS